MTNLVGTNDIERIVGARRMVCTHLGRAVSSERTVYILHSKQCVQSSRDIRSCWYSLALDAGIDDARWDGWEDKPVLLGITRSSGLVPLALVGQ